MRFKYFFIILFIFSSSLNLFAQNQKDEDANKSAIELLYESISLQSEGRLLDSRSKLLKALKKDPREIRVLMSLGDYYLRHVGHFRIALKYIKSAQKILIEDYGKPPYFYSYTRALHGDILSLLSQARLNLDDYEGALIAIKDYKKNEYPGEWVSSSEAWILLKLNRIEEAIRIVEKDIKENPQNFGASSNVLGILYSMVGKRNEAIKILNESTDFEFAKGTYGNPSTPLNNVGEVYKEIFEEDKSEKSFLRATRLPDGCEHVLPSLNMAIIRISQTRFLEAEQSLKEFEECFAQFPLKNGEEHTALLQLARARIALHNGQVDYALKELKLATSRRQWFGKIGTSVDDFKAATYSTYSRALKIKNNQLSLTPNENIINYFKDLALIVENKIKAFWFARKARQVLAEDLNYFEDLYIRHTDSFLEYPTLGELLSGFRKSTLENRIKQELLRDDRKNAIKFYKSYLLIKDSKSLFKKDNLEQRFITLINSLREKKDSLLINELKIEQLKLYNYNEEKYWHLSQEIYEKIKALIYNSGLKLAINTSNLNQSEKNILNKSAFKVINSKDLIYKLGIIRSENSISISFYKNSRLIFKLKGTTLKEVMPILLEKVFVNQIYKG